uniref:Uncharacterized protein n=1 Tax=Glossina austeni TaxID=7395 RepID=A0A1A9UYM6_GLOAU
MRCSTKTQNSLPEKPHEMIPLFLDDKEWFSKLAGSKWDINSLIPYKWFHNNPESNGISSLNGSLPHLRTREYPSESNLRTSVFNFYIFAEYSLGLKQQTSRGDTEIIKNLLKLLVKDFCELSPFVDGLYLYSKRPER